jgi:hypothetical protein
MLWNACDANGAVRIRMRMKKKLLRENGRRMVIS